MMKRLMLLSVLLMIFSSCSSGSEVLLEYNRGKITRAEFNQWLDLHRIPQETVYADQRRVRERLLDMVVERLIADTVEGKTLAADPVVARRMDFSRKSWLAEQASEEIARDRRYAPSVRYTSHIMLEVSRYTLDDKGRRILSEQEYAALLEQKKQLLLDLRKKIVAGADFGELAAQYSSDITSMQKGQSGPALPGLVPDAYYKALDGLGAGEIIAEPVLVDSGLYLIRLDSVEPWTADFVDSLSLENRKKDRIRMLAGNMALENFFSAKSKEFGISINAGESSWCTFQSKQYTRQDVRNIFHDITGREEANDKELVAFTESWLQAEMIAATNDGFGDARAKLREVQHILDGAILLNARQRALVDDIQIDENDILSEYQRNLGTRYSQKEYRQGVLVSTPLPYAQVRDKVRQNLAGQSSMVAIAKWRNGLYSAEGVKVIEKE